MGRLVGAVLEEGPESAAAHPERTLVLIINLRGSYSSPLGDGPIGGDCTGGGA